MVFPEKNNGTVHFLLTKLTENYKIKNLIEVMLRRLEKLTKQLWDTVILYIVPT